MVSNTLQSNLEALNSAKIKLTIPLVANFINQGYTQSDIARMCNISPQAVNSFIDRNKDNVLPLIDIGDNLIALQSKHIATQAIGKIDKILALEKFDKRHLVALNVTAGTQIDKYRLLSGKSTSNVSVDQLVTRKDERNTRKQELMKELQQVKGNV